MSMIEGMTAYGRAQKRFDWGDILWELRSVNYRYFDVVFRTDQNLGVLESTLRQKLADNISRGRVDALLSVSINENCDKSFRLDVPLVKQLTKAACQLTAEVDLDGKLKLKDLLMWPGVLEINSFDLSTAYADVEKVFEEALVDFKGHRLREGSKLKEIIEERLGLMLEKLSSVKLDHDQIKQTQFSRLKRRLAELLGEVAIDYNRLNQEVVFLLQKMDIEEEIDRINLHVDEVKHTLLQPDPVGRRLDFLMQELNREVNTLAAKSQTHELSQLSIDLKVFVEQMREQVQNIA